MKLALRDLRPLRPLLAVLGVIAFVVLCMEPPAPRLADAPPSAFSAARALAHVRQIARAPHPPGSVEHARVREYIVAQLRTFGLDVRVQQTVAWRSQAGYVGYVQAAQVQNIIARLPGREAGDAIMLSAHYDSHPTGPAAGDDGAGVATLLETARALTTGARPARDVLFVITDAEEWGLIGAEGFVRDAPEARNVGVVLNFEARGGGGPVFMFETSDGNASLIGQFARSAPRPLASSLMYSLYKLLPNDTDLSVFKEAGLPGLNFAFAGSWPHYHTALDTPEKLDLRSVQHEGDSALAAARRFSNDKTPPTASGDAAYFDVLSRFLVCYPLGWTPILVTLACVLLVAATIRNRKENGFWGGWGVSVAALPFTLLVGGLAASGFGLAIAPLREQTPWRDPYDARMLEAAVFAVSVGVVWLVWSFLPARFGARPLLLGALVWWGVLACVTAKFLPGAAYLWVWPLAATSLALLARPNAPVIAAGLASLVLTVPTLHGIALLLGFGMPPALGVLAAVAAAPLLPLFRAGDDRPHRLPAVLLVALGCGLIALAYARSASSADRPRTNSLLYFQDADTARWISPDARNDSWTEPFLRDAKPVTGSEIFPWTTRPLRAAPTASLALPAPDVVQRGNRITVRSRRGAQELVIRGDGIEKAWIGGRELPAQSGPFCLRFLAPPAEGITLEIDAPNGAQITVDDYAYGLPSGTPPRPAQFIAGPLAPMTERTIVRTRAAVRPTTRSRAGANLRINP